MRWRKVELPEFYENVLLAYKGPGGWLAVGAGCLNDDCTWALITDEWDDDISGAKHLDDCMELDLHFVSHWAPLPNHPEADVE